jgi:hypothetical protein
MHINNVKGEGLQNWLKNTLLQSRKPRVGNIKEENGAHMPDKRVEKLTWSNVTVSSYKNSG